MADYYTVIRYNVVVITADLILQPRIPKNPLYRNYLPKKANLALRRVHDDDRFTKVPFFKIARTTYPKNETNFDIG